MVGQNLISTHSSAVSTLETPLTIGVSHPHPHDVLCGRGGASNTHIGNVNFRAVVNKNKGLYASCPKQVKGIVARSIVETILLQSPPGRFLEKKKTNGLWYEVDYEAAVEKTKQTLRETRAFAAAARDIPDDGDREVGSSEATKGKRKHDEHATTGEFDAGHGTFSQHQQSMPNTAEAIQNLIKRPRVDARPEWSFSSELEPKKLSYHISSLSITEVEAMCQACFDDPNTTKRSSPIDPPAIKSSGSFTHRRFMPSGLLDSETEKRLYQEYNTDDSIDSCPTQTSITSDISSFFLGSLSTDQINLLSQVTDAKPGPSTPSGVENHQSTQSLLDDFEDTPLQARLRYFPRQNAAVTA